MPVVIEKTVSVDRALAQRAERKLRIVNREHFDYTEWQKNLFPGETVRSLGAKVMAFAAPNP